ncbi:MAG: gephyrin-like molybdotransferase Glp [Sphingomonadaceae bacterium]
MLLDVVVEQALSLVLGTVSPLESETRPLLDCLGYVLAEEASADIDIPPFDNSAMDGYAVIAADTAAAGPDRPIVLRVIADLPAGYPPPSSVRSGEAVRIMTGAPMPRGTDAVVRTEDVEQGEGTVRISRPVSPGDDLRKAGEDVRKGEVILRPGTVLRPGEIGMLASLGRTRVRVIRTPRVAVLTTGDELVAPDEPVTPGKIRNSNLYSICAQVRACGGEPVPLGVARDTAGELEAKIRDGIAKADMLLTSGGVSVGDYDVVKTVLAKVGEILFWRVKMRPGSPVTFGKIDGKPMFGLPGNPSASMVAFEQFVRPAILKMSGRTRLRRREVEATVQETIKNRVGVRNFIRAVATERDGEWSVRTAGAQGSGILRTMVQANALLVVPENVGKLQPGERAKVQLLDLPEVE